MFDAWAPLLAVLALLACLWWVSRQMAFFFMSSIYLVTRSQAAAASVYALFILPGTLMHEASHWLMASLVGVRTGKVDLLPAFNREGALRLGAVGVRGGKLWQHSLIGLAPLVVGSLLTMWLSYGLVDVAALAQGWRTQGVSGLIAGFAAALQQPDAMLGVYLLFTVSDAMFLSASDRAPVKRMLIYLAVGMAAVYLLSGAPTLSSGLALALQEGFRIFAWGLLVALAVHAGFAVLFAAVYALLRGIGLGGRV